MNYSIRYLLLAVLLLPAGLAGAQTHRANTLATGPQADARTRAAAATSTAAQTPVPEAAAEPVVEFTPAASTGVMRDSIYVNPDKLPAFLGGEGAMAAYLRKNIRYPTEALQRHISGKVYVNFILSAQGRVTDAHVVRGPGAGLNEEALRLVWLMPIWQPGRQLGQPVRVSCTVPINFDSGR